jgi:hypothetical protein
MLNIWRRNTEQRRRTCDERFPIAHWLPLENKIQGKRQQRTPNVKTFFGPLAPDETSQMQVPSMELTFARAINSTKLAGSLTHAQVNDRRARTSPPS